MFLVPVLATLALAAPDREVARFVTTSAVDTVVASPDGSWVAWTTSDGQVVALDTTTWTEWPVTLGAGTADGPVALSSSSGTPRLAVATTGGAVEVFTLDLTAGAVPERSLSAGANVHGLVVDGESVYAIVDGSGNDVAMSWSLATGAASETQTTLGASGFRAVGARWTSASSEDGDEGGATASTVSYLYVVHGSDNVSRVATPALTTVTNYDDEGSRDLSDLWVDDGSLVWLSDETSYTASFGYVSGDDAELDLQWITDPNVGPVYDLAGTTVGAYIAAATDDGLHFFNIGEAGVFGEELSWVELSSVRDLAAAEGHAFAASSDGVVVLSDRPWVEITALSATSGLPGDAIDVGFSSDTAGGYAATLVPVEGGDGIVAAEGSVEAGEAAAFSFEIPDGTDDTTYRLELAVDPADGGMPGRDSTFVARDALPPEIVLPDDAVMAGDRRIIIGFEGVGAENAQSYVVYITTEAFESDDYESGGPAYVGPDQWLTDRGAPLEDRADDLTGNVVCNLDPLTNGTTYYVAIRAIDAENGVTQEGPLSNVFAVTPGETYALSELLGIEGWCGLPLARASWLLVACGAAAALRRRRGLASLLVLAALAPATAQAKPHEDDLTSRHFNLELRYGPFLSQDDDHLTNAFGSDGNRLLRGDIGWASNYAELDLGFGLWADDGTLVSIEGLSSADADALTVLPLSFDVTLRGDVWKEQPVVPFARAGIDLWLWNEQWEAEYDTGGGDSVTAGTFGYHWAGGLYLLLDPLDQGSASRLETTVSVNDTYIVAEYRQSFALGEPGEVIDFTSTELTFGLKFDY